MDPEISMTEEAAPKPGTKAALEAENAALKAELEAMKVNKAKTGKTKAAEVAEEPIRMVTVKIPRLKKDQEDAFVRVNRRTYLIKRGVNVEVPWFVAEVLQHQEQMLEIIMEYDDQHRNKNA